MTATPSGDHQVERLSRPRPVREQLAEDVRRGLALDPPTLPPKYLYDARGSELFEAITELPEYYPTRTETAILEQHADRFVACVRPRELVELGSGSSRKTRLLLEAMHRLGSGDRYVPLDISQAAVEGAAAELTEDYGWLEVRGAVGDFSVDLPRLPRDGRRLLAFLGSTIGNLSPRDRGGLLRSVAGTLRPGDAFLLGADLVKPVEVLLPAYDDPRGVTAEFNRNLLRVLNRELEGDLPVDAFGHRAVWNPDAERMEMHLVAQREVNAVLAAIDLPVRFSPGDVLVTEHSHKFRLERLRAELGAAGLSVDTHATDARQWFAVLLCSSAGDT